MIRAAVVGDPVEHSLSPRIFAAWFEGAGIDGIYERKRVPPDGFAALVRELAAGGWNGINVTIPHKSAALALADEASEAAHRIGAANLLTFEGRRIRADNTDHTGFARALREAGTEAEGRKALVLGAGGAAGAIVHALRNCREVAICNRTLYRAEQLADRFDNAVAYPWESRDGVLVDTDILVNTTSLGMEGQAALEIDLASLPDGGVVADIVYAPLQTPLLKQASARGLRTVHGLSMLVWQAVPSFEAVTGRPPVSPETILRELVEERA